MSVLGIANDLCTGLLAEKLGHLHVLKLVQVHLITRIVSQMQASLHILKSHCIEGHDVYLCGCAEPIISRGK